ncbi:hypothetical protein B296_00044252 [Ensete ventricosum]|uniref:Uncharacterized protein n=1 Tax=Ensete ventricosum TaxID=4639 RepID=A0A426XRX8_ENSVE|nr:hypothetical protein B296_00044252 [Ensete ventricosum]
MTREEEARERERRGEPQTVPPTNDDTAARLSETSVAREPRDSVVDEENLTKRRLFPRGLLIVTFSSEAMRERGKHRRLLFTRARRSLGNFSSTRGEENETSPRIGRRKQGDIAFFFYRRGEATDLTESESCLLRAATAAAESSDSNDGSGEQRQ